MLTCKRIKLSCTFYPRSPIKSKIGGKILFQKYVKTNFEFSKISAASNTSENGVHDLSANLTK